METISATTKYGGSAKENRDGFKLAATASVSSEQLVLLAIEGLASILYRGGASVLNETLGVKKNSETEYDSDAAELIADALQKWAKDEKDCPLSSKDEKGNSVPSPFDLSIEVSRYEHGQGSTVKFAAERQVYARHGKAKDLQEFATKMNYDGELGDGSAENAPEAFLQAIKTFVKNM